MENTPELEAHFHQLETINWGDVVEVHSSKLPKGQEDSAISKHIGIAHEHLFRDQDRTPGWKIVVLRHEGYNSNGKTRVDIIYVNNHAIGDGTSAAAFHRTLLSFFYQATNEPDLKVSWPYRVPTELPAFSYIEEAVPFPQQQDVIPTSTTVLQNEPFGLWTAAPPTMEHFVSRVQAITILSLGVSNILAYCRRLGITLTGLLHSLFVIKLAKTIESAHAFRGATPYSMRQFSGVSDDEIVNHISDIDITWKEDLVSLARSAVEGSKEEEGVILAITRQYRNEILEELSNIPTRGSTTLNQISQITDLDQYCEDAMKRKRGCTYEISNIGAVTLPERTEGSEGVELEKLTFTQCAMVAGPALGCSVISIRGKSLVVSLHWQEGILEDGFVSQFAAYLERRLLHLGDAVAA